MDIDQRQKGFDRGADYQTVKKEFVQKMCEYTQEEQVRIRTQRNIVYLTLACIQLRNGSRISEAVLAYLLWLKTTSAKPVFVKISKSKRLDKKSGKTSKERFRKMVFPEWFGDHFVLKDTQGVAKHPRIKKRVLDYLRNNFKVSGNLKLNTHSLRYAFANYLIDVKKTPLNIVAKTLGHVNTNQLCTYTQNKQVDKTLEDNTL